MHSLTNENMFRASKNGLMAEWLGRGLQNLVQRFESASDLEKIPFRQTTDFESVVFFVGCVGYVFAENAAEKSIKIIN